MPVARMRMRPWLEKMIDSNAVSGLMWMDKARTMFSIPWKHAARHGWELDKDACLFKLWAIHTGKYIEGQSSADPKTWKANFRCAMNSLPDIEEVKDKSINKGQQAVRVYRMLPVSSKCKRAKTKDTKHRNKSPRVKSEDCSELSQSPLLSQLDNNTHCTQENTVDSTEQQELMSVDDVPDWSASIEIGPDSTNELCRRFEVSPEHSTEYKDSDSDIDEDIIRICRQMEQDTIWMQKSTDSIAFLTNEVYKSSYSNSSPESHWSDTSSDDIDELPEYTILGELPNADDFLASFRNTFCGGLTVPYL